MVFCLPAKHFCSRHQPTYFISPASLHSQLQHHISQIQDEVYAPGTKHNLRSHWNSFYWFCQAFFLLLSQYYLRPSPHKQFSKLNGHLHRIYFGSSWCCTLMSNWLTARQCSFVTKVQETATSGELCYCDTTGYQAANSFLRTIRPLVSEMI